MHRIYFAVVAIALVGGLTHGVGAQLAEFEQTLSKLEEKLPTDVWDGKTLNVSTYEELQEVRSFLVEYDRLTKVAKDALSRMSDEEQTEERRNKLNGDIEWMNEVVAAFNEKYEVLRPAKLPPFIGPDVSSRQPFVIDTFGGLSTSVSVQNHWPPAGAPKGTPWRYSILASFCVHYDDINQDDIVLLQPMKGGKKLGPPRPCSPSIMAGHPVARFSCETHSRDADLKDLYTASGDIEVKLTYRKVIEGKEFKNFESLFLRVVKQVQIQGPPQWGVDHDIELGPSIIVEIHNEPGGRGWASDVARAIAASSTRRPGTGLKIHTMFKSNGSDRPENMSCLHKGKRVFEGEVGTGWSATLKSFKGGKWDVTSWRESIIYMPFVRTRPGPNEGRDVYFMSENPGKYKCVITGGGEVLKELHFEAEANGEIVKHPCQAKSMNSSRSVTLVSSKLKKSYDEKWDEQIVARRGYGGGVTWVKGCPPTE